MAYFSHSASTDRSRSRAGCGRFRRDRTRFTPAADFLEVRALLSTLVVTNTDDSGPGSLRNAITDAPSGSTIQFANSLKGGTITLTSGVVSINQNLNIDGPGAGKLAVSGGGESQVFDIGSGALVTISGLTITDGLSAVTGVGGGIVNAGNLTLDGTDVTNNQAAGFSASGGGIENDGNLTIKDSEVTGNQANGTIDAAGGGIDNAGTLTIDHSVIANNEVLSSNDGSSVEGGGIFSQFSTTTTIDDSTIANNMAVGGPGDFFGASGAGGAIFGEGGTLTISGSTLSGNEAVGGSNDNEGGSAIGGAIDLEGPSVLNMTNTIVTNNQAIGGRDRKSVV